jgi:hypothetical protein
MRRGWKKCCITSQTSSRTSEATFIKENIMQIITPDWRFWLFWALAFLGFPIAGVLSNLAGPVDSALKGVVAGLIAGAVIGTAEWLVLRGPLGLPPAWILATAAGMAVGLGLSTALLGSETGGSELLLRAAVTGLCIGLAQWFILRGVVPQAFVWVVALAVAWTAGWYVTRSAGVDLSFKWSVFGASGAITFQFVTGLALYYLTRFAK